MNPDFAAFNGAFSQQNGVPKTGSSSAGKQRTQLSASETQWSDFTTSSGTSAWNNQTGSSFAGMSAFTASPTKNPTDDVFEDFSWAGQRPGSATFGTTATAPVMSNSTQFSSPQPRTPPVSYLDDPLTNSQAFNNQMSRSASSFSEMKRSNSASSSSSGRSTGGTKKSSTPLARMVKTPSQSSVNMHIPALLPPPSTSSTFIRPPSTPTKQSTTDLLGDLEGMFSTIHVPALKNFQTEPPNVVPEKNQPTTNLIDRFSSLNVASEPPSSVANPLDDFGDFSSAIPATDSDFFYGTEEEVSSTNAAVLGPPTSTGLGIVDGDSEISKATLAEIASLWKATLLECLEEFKNARKWCVDVERTCPGEEGRTQKQMLRRLSKVSDYVDGVAIYHQISRSISESYPIHESKFETITCIDLTRFISDIEREWEGLVTAGKTIGFEISSNHVPSLALSESHHTPPFCSLCLRSLNSASKRAWGGKEYHIPCANMVIHRLQKPSSEISSWPEL